jgi:hypothetical protein
MGEAKLRKEMGLPPRILKPGDQIPIDLKNAIQRQCECECKYFIPVIELYSVSALVSPFGKETFAQKPALVCLKCQKPFNLKPVEG